MWVACDVDGTLALGFFDPRTISNMEPNPQLIRTLRGLSRAGIKIMVVTARPEQYRAQTVAWLKSHDVPYHRLTMRARGDNRSSPDLRTEQVKGAMVLFDDREDNCRRVGIPCVVVVG